jgi:pyruvate/2-oxoglutarate dehydrogenase complex dihydrolipoamide dehydrogenase (E3) component
MFIDIDSAAADAAAPETRSGPRAGSGSMSSGHGEERYDLVVVGAGSAGLAAATSARRSGARVLVVERERPGGSCLWTGTVPSKALIAAARTAHAMRTADRYGIRPVEPEVNFGELMRGIQARITAAAPETSSDALRALGVDIVMGDARFTGPETIAVDDQIYRFSRAIIATGSGPVMPVAPGLADCGALTVESFWSLRSLPARLTLIGGGPTGCELGQALARLGAEITIIEQADRLLPSEEPEVGALIADRLRQEGVEVLTGTSVLRAMAYGRHTELMISDAENAAGPQTRTIEAGRILITAGRRPATVGLDLHRAGVSLNEQGYVRTDERLRTTNRRIFAAGDAIGDRPLASLAASDGEIAAVNAMTGRSRTVRHDLGPQVVFTDPEVGRVGHTESTARAVMGDLLQVRTPAGRIDRAVSENESAGFTKIINDDRGRLVGATIVSPRAGEVITELATVLQSHGRIGDLAAVPHAYPTWSDAVWNAALEDQAESRTTPVGQRLTGSRRRG